MEIYLSIQKPLAYNAKPFSKAVVEKIVKRIAEIESQANGMDIGDGFLSNFGDVNYEGLSAVIKDAAKLISSDETALDQLSGIVGSGVSPAYVNQATKEITGHDGVIAKGFSNSGDEGNTIFVAFFPSQIKSAIDNAGTFSSESDDIRMSRRQQSIQGQQFLLNGETFNEEKRRQIQDYFIRVKAVQEQLALQGGVVSEKQDVYQAEELSYGRIQEQMREFKSKVVEPLLKDVQKRKLTLPELAMYAYAKHAPERNAAMQAINPKLPPGTGSGMTNTEARQIIAQFRTDGKLQDLEDLHNQLMVIASTTRQLLLVEGLITQEEFDAWDSKYDNYVPLRGFVEDETDVVDGVDAAEEDVSVGPAGDFVAAALEAVEGVGVDSGLGVDDARLEVNSGGVDRLLDREAAESRAQWTGPLAIALADTEGRYFGATGWVAPDPRRLGTCLRFGAHPVAPHDPHGCKPIDWDAMAVEWD